MLQKIEKSKSLKFFIEFVVCNILRGEVWTYLIIRVYKTKKTLPFAV